MLPTLASAIINRINDFSEKTTCVLMNLKHSFQYISNYRQAFVCCDQNRKAEYLWRSIHQRTNSGVYECTLKCVVLTEMSKKFKTFTWTYLGTFHVCRFSHIKRFLLGYETHKRHNVSLDFLNQEKYNPTKRGLLYAMRI